MHDSGTQFKVKMGFYTLLGYRFGHAFTVAAFELSGEEISKPRNFIACQLPSGYE